MRTHGWVGLLLLLLAHGGLYLELEPIATWFYCFAWWSYILLVDAALARIRGRSLLLQERRALLLMLPLSVFIWLVFEAYNLALHNWSYQEVPGGVWLRWPGYLISFATVLPAIFLTSELASGLIGSGPEEACWNCSPRTLPTVSVPLPAMQWFGLVLCLGPLFLPRIFFPTVWIGPIFLIDPVLERLGIRSLSQQIAEGERRKIWSLMIGGTACGLLWELWNFWARSKWIYTLPYFEAWKVFEMPVLGFLGFPPFALECWILYHLCLAVLARCRSRFRRILFWLAIASFSLWVLNEIDRKTATTIFEEAAAPCALFYG